MKGEEHTISPNQRRVLDVIVIRDNRDHPTHERTPLPILPDKAHPDFRSSAYKGTHSYTQKLKSIPSSFKKTSSTILMTKTYSQNSTNASPIFKIECKPSKRRRGLSLNLQSMKMEAEGAKCVAKTRSSNETGLYLCKHVVS